MSMERKYTMILNPGEYHAIFPQKLHHSDFDHYVYGLVCQSSLMCKFGVTKNLAKRMRMYQTHAPTYSSMLCFFLAGTDDRSVALSLERSMSVSIYEILAPEVGQRERCSDWKKIGCSMSKMLGHTNKVERENWWLI